MSTIKKENAIIYERKFKLMGNNNQRRSEKIKEIINTTGGFLGSIAIICAAIFYVVSSITRLEENVNFIKEDREKIKEEYKTLYTKIDDLSDDIDDLSENFIDVSSYKQEEAAYRIEFKDTYEVRTIKINQEEYLAPPSWEKESVIAGDYNGDIVYKAEQLYNTPIITSYLDGENEVYFYGKFNENNHWNGRCILNVYNKDNLVSIFEGVYTDGVLFSYERVSAEDENIWIVNKRVVEDGYNKGETFIYSKEKDFVKDFGLNDFKEKQVISVDNFLESRNEKILSYYNGNTSNGKYNDSTGMAYLVKYKEDGNVDILYEGCFKNGEFNDNTGESWFIGWGNDNNGYYYYKGTFTNGKHGKPPKNWKPMTQEEIDDIVDPERYNCLLAGLVGDQS